MAENQLVDKTAKDAEQGKKTGDTSTAFASVYKDLSKMSSADGGAKSAAFKHDLAAVNAKLHADGILPNVSIAGIDSNSNALLLSDGASAGQARADSTATAFAGDFYPGLPSSQNPDAPKVNNAVSAIEKLDLSKENGKQLSGQVDAILKANGLSGNDEASKAVAAKLESDGKLAPVVQRFYADQASVSRSDLQKAIGSSNDPANKFFAQSLLDRFNAAGDVRDDTPGQNHDSLSALDLKVWAGIRAGSPSDQIAAGSQFTRASTNTLLVETSDKTSNVPTLRDLANGKGVSLTEINNDLKRKGLTSDQQSALEQLQQVVAPDAWMMRGNSKNPNPPDNFTITNKDVDNQAFLSGTNRPLALSDKTYIDETTGPLPGSPQSDVPLTSPLPDGGSKTVTKGQLTEIHYPGGAGSTFSYDGSGKLVGISDVSPKGAQSSYKLDAAGKWVNSDTGQPAPFSDAGTSPDGTVSYSDGKGSTFSVASDGTVTTPTGPGSTLSTNQERQITKVTYPDGSGRSFAYDAHGKLTQISDYSANGGGANFTLGSDGKWINSDTGKPAPFSAVKLNSDGSLSVTDSHGQASTVGVDGSVSQTVQPGDYLYKIIERNYPKASSAEQYTILQKIIELNREKYPGLASNPDSIQAGQQITLPTGGSSGW